MSRANRREAKKKRRAERQQKKARGEQSLASPSLTQEPIVRLSQTREGRWTECQRDLAAGEFYKAATCAHGLLLTFPDEIERNQDFASSWRRALFGAMEVQRPSQWSLALKDAISAAEERRVLNPAQRRIFELTEKWRQGTLRLEDGTSDLPEPARTILALVVEALTVSGKAKNPTAFRAEAVARLKAAGVSGVGEKNIADLLRHYVAATTGSGRATPPARLVSASSVDPRFQLAVTYLARQPVKLANLSAKIWPDCRGPMLFTWGWQGLERVSVEKMPAIPVDLRIRGQLPFDPALGFLAQLDERSFGLRLRAIRDPLTELLSNPVHATNETLMTLIALAEGKKVSSVQHRPEPEKFAEALLAIISSIEARFELLGLVPASDSALAASKIIGSFMQNARFLKALPKGLNVSKLGHYILNLTARMGAAQGISYLVLAELEKLAIQHMRTQRFSRAELDVLCPIILENYETWEDEVDSSYGELGHINMEPVLLFALHHLATRDNAKIEHARELLERFGIAESKFAELISRFSDPKDRAELELLHRMMDPRTDKVKPFLAAALRHAQNPSTLPVVLRALLAFLVEITESDDVRLISRPGKVDWDEEFRPLLRVLAAGLNEADATLQKRRWVTERLEECGLEAAAETWKELWAARLNQAPEAKSEAREHSVLADRLVRALDDNDKETEQALLTQIRRNVSRSLGKVEESVKAILLGFAVFDRVLGLRPDREDDCSDWTEPLQRAFDALPTRDRWWPVAAEMERAMTELEEVAKNRVPEEGLEYQNPIAVMAPRILIWLTWYPDHSLVYVLAGLNEVFVKGLANAELKTHLTMAGRLLKLNKDKMVLDLYERLCRLVGFKPV